MILLDVAGEGRCSHDCGQMISNARHAWPTTHFIVLRGCCAPECVIAATSAGAKGYLGAHDDALTLALAIKAVILGYAAFCPKAQKILADALLELHTAASSSGLTRRQQQVMHGAAGGLLNKEIASRLFISTGTVRTHLMHIFEKLHVRCRTEAAAKYLRSNQPALPRVRQ